MSLAAVGAEHALALAENGAIYTWGARWQRFRTQAPTGLGLGQGSDAMVPTRVHLKAGVGRW